MVRPARARALVLLSLLLSAGPMASGCGSDSSPSGPGGGGGGSGPISARVDGVAWSAPTAGVQALASAAPGQLGFIGVSLTAPSISMGLTLGHIPGPGTYPLGVNVFSNAGGTGTVGLNGIASNTPLNGSAGTVTIATLSATRVTGTFSFVAEPISGGGAPVVVTDGSFDVPLSAGFVPVAGVALGSSTSVTLGSVEWNAATVVGIGSSGTYTFTSSNTEYTMTCVIGPIDTPGQGALTLSSPVRRIHIIRSDGTAAWGASANDIGTITVEAVSSTRISGTFEGTLTASVINDTDDPLIITDGHFDVRVP